MKRLAWAPQHRAPIGPEAVRAAYRAHRDLEHGQVVGYGCTTCGRYLGGIARAVEATSGPTRETIGPCRSTTPRPAAPATATSTAAPEPPT